MSSYAQSLARTVGGLRTRFFPRSRIWMGLVTVAPWINLALLMVLFSMLDAKLVLQPGVAVALPEGQFAAGVRPSLVAVVLSVGEGQERREVVFFDDSRYLVAQKQQMENLALALASRVARQPEADLVIEADRGIPHGTVVRLMNMARSVRVRSVSIAIRKEE
jgi:biopolymer transport protein ExbD